MVSASPELWELLSDLYRGGAYRQEFQAAWQNGVAFLAAADGLRGRVPLVVEWRGGQRQPGDEPVPADLRIDHVFLISCKYLSHIVSNSSPASVFDRLLAGGHGGRSADWFAEVAPEAYEALYRAVRDHLRGDADVGIASGGDGDPAAGFRDAVERRVGSVSGVEPSVGLRGDVEVERSAGLGDAVERRVGSVRGVEPSVGLGGDVEAAPGLRGVAESASRPAGTASQAPVGAPGDVGSARLEKGAGALAGAAGSSPSRPHARSRAELDELPASVLDLTNAQRTLLQRLLGSGQWAAPLRPAAAAFSEAVAQATAARWQRALVEADTERALWRLLRIGSTPYFVLGAAKQGSLRLRIGTAWDWRQHFRIEDFSVLPAARSQPVVEWQVVVAHRRSTQRTTIEGHVEIRWSHGKFAQPPEAKVYLDTPHHRVPGYWPLS